MKKFKLTVPKSAPDKDVWLFDDTESLMIWLVDFEACAHDLEELEEATLVTLSHGDKTEVEWLGCEFFMINDRNTRFDLVKLVKASPCFTKRGLSLAAYSGWICEELLVLRQGHFCGLNVKKIKEDESEVLMPSDDQVKHGALIEEVSETIKSLNLPKV